MLKAVLAACCVLLLQACASTKGYEEKKRPESELATIYAADPQKYGVVAKHYVLIEQVNDIEVGDAVKGYPRKVYVLPGEVRVRVKFDTMTFGKAVAVGALAGAGGAVGGAIAGAANSSGGTPNNEIVYEVEEGKSYKINFSSESHSASDLKVWLEPYVEQSARRVREGKQGNRT